MNGHAVRHLVVFELRQFFHRPASLHLIPFLLPAVVASVWQYTPSAVPVAILAALLALEPQYNNILYRSPREFDAISLMPLEYRTVVVAKNIATLLLTLLLLAVSSGVIFSFARRLPDAGELGEGTVYLSTLVFTLLQTGNTRSLHFPRRRTGWCTEDAVEAFGFLLVIGVCSLPYLVLGLWAGLPLLCLLYGAAAGFRWLGRSTRRTAARMLEDQERLCKRP